MCTHRIRLGYVSAKWSDQGAIGSLVRDTIIKQAIEQHNLHWDNALRRKKPAPKAVSPGLVALSSSARRKLKQMTHWIPTQWLFPRSPEQLFDFTSYALQAGPVKWSDWWDDRQWKGAWRYVPAKPFHQTLPPLNQSGQSRIKLDARSLSLSLSLSLSQQSRSDKTERHRLIKTELLKLTQEVEVHWDLFNDRGTVVGPAQITADENAQEFKWVN